jgi:hypothetical protein
MATNSKKNLRTLFHLLILSVFVLNAEMVLAQSPEIDLTEEEQAWLAEQPVLNLGVDPSWASFEYFDSKGELASITSDNIRILTQ